MFDEHNKKNNWISIWYSYYIIQGVIEIHEQLKTKTESKLNVWKKYKIYNYNKLFKIYVCLKIRKNNIL